MEQQACKNFLSGNCSRGAQCKFMHPGTAPGERKTEACLDFLAGR